MLAIGSLLDGKYKILSEVGRGGMSVVYMARNEKANKTWAVKEVRKDGKMDFNTVKQGLIAEIDTLKNLKHSSLPSIIDVIDDADSFIIVMDYIEGNSLDKTLEEYGPQPEAYVVEWAKQLCDVLGYLHSRVPPIIYRDMKPANVMLKPDGDITLIDFGTAKTYEINLGDTTGIGTIGYAAPEQYIGSGLGRTDARTDIYCLGMTLYHLLTGIDPCKNLISDRSVTLVNPALSPGLDSVIIKCTEYQPDDRYQSCAELLYDLEHYEDLEPEIRRQKKGRLRAFFCVALLSVLFIVGGVGLRLFASRMATNTYHTMLADAMHTSDFDAKIQLLEECVAVADMGGEKDAYLALIQAYKDNDAVFTADEAASLEKLISNNRKALMQKPATYTEICFETGKLFWYYFNSSDTSNNQITNATRAIEWFNLVLENAPEGYSDYGMAQVYYNIGDFYRKIITNVTEASDKGKYKPLYDNFSELIRTIAVDDSESDIVRLELLEMARSAIQQYATKFKGDGVTGSELTLIVQDIEKITKTINTTTEKTDEKKETILRLISDTKAAVEIAYGTTRGGD